MQEDEQGDKEAEEVKEEETDFSKAKRALKSGSGADGSKGRIHKVDSNMPGSGRFKVGWQAWVHGGV